MEVPNQKHHPKAKGILKLGKIKSIAYIQKKPAGKCIGHAIFPLLPPDLV